MNQQERDLINQLLKQLTDVKLSAKDQEAEDLIRQASYQQPDALYLLVQRNLLLEHALNNAKAQLDDLHTQLQSSQQTKKSGFFDNNPWGQSVNTSPPSTPLNRYAAQAAQPVQAGSGFLGGSSGFLGNVATTAAGVVAGSFLFQGIENLMGHHSYGLGQQPFEDQLAENTVINNYYGDDAIQTASTDNDLDSNVDTAGYVDGDDFDNGNDSDWT